jgi:probable rRNA maturation factor
MKKLPINFFQEDVQCTLKNKTALRNWINNTISSEGLTLEELNFIFCSDEYLLKINQEYLNHDTYTDIITFDNSDEKELVLSDIFISIDRIKENSKKFGVSFKNELHRVIIHGVLHLLGYPDKKKDEKSLMTQKEDFYLALRDF